MRLRTILTSDKLVFLKQKAIRKRVWFKILDRAERAIVDLTIQTVKKIRSSTLKEMLMTISRKSMEAMESQVARLAFLPRARAKVKTVGVPVFVTLKNRSAKPSFRMLVVIS